MPDTTLNEKIEANADLTLWCVHILGPDDVLAAPCHDAAVVHARRLNELLHSRCAHPRSAQRSGAPDDILCFAYAAPWPYSREDHARAVKDWPNASAIRHRSKSLDKPPPQAPGEET